MKLTCGVYKILNTANGKFYIGCSNNVFQRWSEHKNDLRNKTHHSIHLQRAWDKYGEDNFVFELIEETDENDRIEHEQCYLNNLKPYDKNVGYNISPNAIGGSGYGEDNGFFGKEHTVESKIKISNRQYYNKNGNPTNNLNEQIVEQIKIRLVENNTTKKKLAQEFNVNEETIRSISLLKSWNWVKKDLNEALVDIKNNRGKISKNIINLYNSGHSIKDIIGMGYKTTTVYKTINKIKEVS
jgi:group I intron endonuclease